MSEWLYIKKQKPKHNQLCLCRMEMNDQGDYANWYDVLNYDSAIKNWRYQQTGEKLTSWHNVTHWMPLPQPPEGDSK